MSLYHSTLHLTQANNKTIALLFFAEPGEHITGQLFSSFFRTDHKVNQAEKTIKKTHETFIMLPGMADWQMLKAEVNIDPFYKEVKH